MKQKHKKLLQRSLSWLLLFGTLLTAVAGNTLPVRAADSDVTSHKYSISYDVFTKSPAGGYRYVRNEASFSSDNRLFLYFIQS